MLVHQDKLEAALAIFEINTREFPQSTKAWQSLAKCHEMAGNKGKAKKYYQKSISLDPENTDAREALAALE